MATNPMQRKSRNSFLLGILITVLIMGAIVALLLFQLMKMKEEENKRSENSTWVCTLTSDVKSGDSISAAMIAEVKVVNEAVPTDAIPKSALTEKSIAKIDLAKGTTITSAMIQESGDLTTNDLRVQEYNMIKLSSQLTSDDYIDIRLRMPSGLDYIVVSKKRVEVPTIDGVDSENTIWLKLTEAETITMSNAIVEAYIMDGAVLYTANYVEPGLQESATPTYVPSANVQYLIQQNPNITTEAKNALITRYNNTVSTRNNINNELSQYSDKTLEGVEAGVETEVQTSQEQRKAYLDALSGN